MMSKTLPDDPPNSISTLLNWSTLYRPCLSKKKTKTPMKLYKLRAGPNKSLKNLCRLLLKRLPRPVHLFLSMKADKGLMFCQESSRVQCPT
ncbi:Hypothetical protein NTJ_13529 [Nesidiocoris tenuis]|uniref:Uncharacterized protein n=1 Tax=Nesidiocoris tenuis TaxID=355587 RepID=A0ABN7BA85_9HEMI|nr:Hypothetical protein NTJ_13529 [Nesidiocoris tenuis]